MKCPACRGDCNVADSREQDGGLAHWRKRRCVSLRCGFEWETLEFQTAKRTVYVPVSDLPAATPRPSEGS